MKLFKCHAVMPSEARSRLARTYLVIAENWQRARGRVLELEPKAEFITVPVEAPDAHLAIAPSEPRRSRGTPIPIPLKRRRR